MLPFLGDFRGSQVSLTRRGQSGGQQHETEKHRAKGVRRKYQHSPFHTKQCSAAFGLEMYLYLDLRPQGRVEMELTHQKKEGSWSMDSSKPYEGGGDGVIWSKSLCEAQMSEAEL